MTKTQLIKEMHSSNPGMTTADIAEEVGCSRRLVRNALQGQREVNLNPAKILLFDLETAPMEAYVWQFWGKSGVAPRMMIPGKNWSLLSWSAKWLFEDTVYGEVVTPTEAHNRTDDSIVQSLWTLMEEADIIVAHNGNKFDIKKMNARFLMNGMNPPTPYRSIDTLSVLRRTFGFADNSMDGINEQLGLMTKMEHEGIGMWHKCVNGSRPEAAQALNKMLSYNKVDVLALEDLYMKVRPWIKSHPNVNLYQETLSDDQFVQCPNCGSRGLEWKGNYYTPAGRYNSFRCNACGAIGRSRYSDIGKEERKSLGLSVAS